MDEDLILYTSSPSAIYGASFIAVSPEHFLAYKAREEVIYVKLKISVLHTKKIKAEPQS